MNETLMEALTASGYPREKMFNHYSDLYVFATNKTQRVINLWFKEQGLNRLLFVSTFNDLVTGKVMYDIAFQYDPYWEEIARREVYSGTTQLPSESTK